MLNSSIAIQKRNSFVIGGFAASANRLSLMKRKPLSDADREAAANLRKIWNAKKADLGLTQDKAAELMGFATQGAVSHYLNGHTPLNTDAVLKFSSLLRVDPEEIKPDVKARISRAAACRTGLSSTACNVLDWMAAQSASGKLTDSDLLLLRGRAEQLIDDQDSGLHHDWIIGGFAPKRRKN